MSSTESYVANAEQYAASFDKGHLPLPPAKQTAVVACMEWIRSPPIPDHSSGEEP